MQLKGIWSGHFLILGFILLTACGRASSSPTATSAALETSVAPTLTATFNASPTPSPSPTRSNTPTPQPTNTQIPSQSPTPTLALPVALGTNFPTPAALISADTVQRITTLARQGDGWIIEVEFSPDGRWMAVATTAGAYLYDASTRVLVSFVYGDGAVAFSPDSQLLAIAYFRAARIVRVQDGVVVHTLSHHNHPRDLAFSPDGQWLLTGSTAEAHLWRVDTGAPGRRIEYPGYNDVEAVAFSPDGMQFVLALGGNRRSELRRLSDGELVATFGAAGWVKQARFSPDGAFVLTSAASATGDWRLWRASSGTSLLTAPGPVGFSPDGRWLAVPQADGSVQVLSAEDLAVAMTLSGHTDLVVDSAFSPDGAQIAITSRDGTVRVWATSDGQLLKSISTEGYALDVFYTPDGGQLVGVLSGNTLMAWDSAGLDQAMRHDFGDAGGRYFALSADGRLLAVDGQLRRQADGTQLTETSRDDCATEAAFTPDGSIVAYAVYFCRQATTVREGYIEVRSVAGDRILQTLDDGHAMVLSLAFSQDGQTLAAGYADAKIRLWSLVDGQLKRVMNAGGQVLSLAYSPDGTWLASGEQTPKGAGQIHLWTADGVLETTLARYPESAWPDVHFTPDGTTVLSGTQGMVILSAVPDGQQLIAIAMDWADGNDAAISADGSVIITAGYEDFDHENSGGWLKFWSTTDGSLLREIRIHTGPFLFALSADGLLLTTQSVDGTSLVLGVRP